MRTSGRDDLIRSFEHQAYLPRADEALQMLRDVASLVRPIMKRRRFRVDVLSEMVPWESQGLLGLNVGGGLAIFLRLRDRDYQDEFLPMREVIDTMLHELSHNVFGPHDWKFHNLWNELRAEYEALLQKRLSRNQFPGTGHKLGGKCPKHGSDIRKILADAAEKRLKLLQGSMPGPIGFFGTIHRPGMVVHYGNIRFHNTNKSSQTNKPSQARGPLKTKISSAKSCASGTKDAVRISEEASKHGSRTDAHEQEVNDKAIAHLLSEMILEEESRLAGISAPSTNPQGHNSAWQCTQCTLINEGKDLSCVACQLGRPSS